MDDMELAYLGLVLAGFCLFAAALFIQSLRGDAKKPHDRS